MIRLRGAERGVTEIVAVLMLAVVGLGWAAYDFQRRAEAEEYARGRASGAVFASWLLAAHRRAQEFEDAYRTALGGDIGVPIDLAADLQATGLAPGWLVSETVLGQRIELGVISDGAGVPMAFAVADPRRLLTVPAEEGFAAGAAEGGVVGIEVLGSELGAETFSGGRQAGIEDAIGRSLGSDDLVAVADLGIAYDDRVIHRRAQPGRPYLSEMRTDLGFTDPDGSGPLPRAGIRVGRDADGNGGVVFGETMEVSGPATPPATAAFVVGRAVTDPDYDVDGDGTVGMDVAGDVLAGAAGGDGSVEANVVEGHRALRLDELRADRWRVNGALDVGRGVARQELAAIDVNATSTLAAGPVLAVDGELEATGVFTGQDIAASNAGSGTMSSGTVEATATVRGESSSASELRVSGTLTVSQACYGCSL